MPVRRRGSPPTRWQRGSQIPMRRMWPLATRGVQFCTTHTFKQAIRFCDRASPHQLSEFLRHLFVYVADHRSCITVVNRQNSFPSNPRLRNQLVQSEGSSLEATGHYTHNSVAGEMPVSRIKIKDYLFRSPLHMMDSADIRVSRSTNWRIRWRLTFVA